MILTLLDFEVHTTRVLGQNMKTRVLLVAFFLLVLENETRFLNFHKISNVMAYSKLAQDKDICFGLLMDYMLKLYTGNVTSQYEMRATI